MTASLKNLYTQIRKSLLERQKIVQILFLLLCTTITTNGLFAQSEDLDQVYSESDFGFSEVRAKATRAPSSGNTYADAVSITSPTNNSCYNGTTAVTITATANNTLSYFKDDFEGTITDYWDITTTNSTADGDGNVWRWQKKAGTGGGSTSPKNGSYNAGLFYKQNSSYISYMRLKTDLSACSNISVHFWYICPAWSDDYDVLELQYSTNGSAYTTLATYSQKSSWTEVSNLSIPNGTKYIRFAATSGYGYGIGIDDFWINYEKPASYTWEVNAGTSGTASGRNYTVTPTNAVNTYKVTTDGGMTASVTLNVLNATISGGETICSGSSTNLTVNFTGTNTFTYRITGDGANRTLATGTSATIPVSVANTYQITQLSDAHCSNVSGSTSGSATVTVASPPTINTISAPTAICDGQKITAPSVTVTQNNGTQSASGWQYSATENGQYTNFNPTTKTWAYSENGYYIRYYSTNQCGTTYSNKVQATVKPNPTITLTKNPDATICSNATMEITASGTGSSYTWNCSGTAGTPSGTGNSVYSLPAQANNYTVTCQSSLSGCTSTATTTVSIYPSLASGAGEIETETLIRCVGTTNATELITSVTDAEGNGVQYQWYKNDNAITNANGATYTIPSSDLSAAAGTIYRYTRKVTDACYSTPQQSDGEYTVQIVAQPSITSVSSEQGVCNNQPASPISVSATGGYSLNYQWYAGSTPVGTNSASYTPFTTATGTTNYHCVVSSTYGGCNSVTSNDIPVTVYRLPSVTASTFANSCTEYGLVLTATPTAGDGTISSYSWEASSPNAGTPCVASASPTCTVTPTVAGTYTYKVTVTDSHFCTASAQTGSVAVYSRLDVDFSPDAADDIYYDDEAETGIEIIATPSDFGSGQYSWSSSVIGETTSSTTYRQTVTPVTTAIYTVTATAASGCSITGSRTAYIRVNTGIECGVMYVDNAASVSGQRNGSSAKPFLTINDVFINWPTGANAPTADHPLHVRIAGSSTNYTTNAPISLNSHVILDGGWTNNNGNWTKGSTNATTLMRSSTMEGSGRNARIVAIEGNSVSDFKIQDMTIKTANAPTQTESVSVPTYADVIGEIGSARTDAVNINTVNGTAQVVTTGFRLYDSGGSSGNYSNNESYNVILFPANGGKLRISGRYTLESLDYLNVGGNVYSGTQYMEYDPYSDSYVYYYTEETF